MHWKSGAHKTVIVLPVKSSPPNSMMKCRAQGKKNARPSFGKMGQAFRTSTGMPPAAARPAIPPNVIQRPARTPKNYDI